MSEYNNSYSNSPDLPDKIQSIYNHAPTGSAQNKAKIEIPRHSIPRRSNNSNSSVNLNNSATSNDAEDSRPNHTQSRNIHLQGAIKSFLPSDQYSAYPSNSSDTNYQNSGLGSGFVSKDSLIANSPLSGNNGFQDSRETIFSEEGIDTEDITIPGGFNPEVTSSEEFETGASSSVNPSSYTTHPFHISSRLSSLQGDDSRIASSAPQSPSTSSANFDFTLHQAVTDSSLNVLIDDSSIKKSRDLDDDVLIESTNNAPASRDSWSARRVSDSSSNRVITRNATDFKFGKQLGEGSYSTVVLGTDKHTNKQYAVKILDKRHIIKEKKVKYVNIEKHALNRLISRMGIISLYFTFQDKSSLYFVLDYASNGELLGLIKKYNTLNEDCVRHFGAQILDAIKYMHDNGVIHRDIKPENILLDDKMRIQITDFGTARLLEKKNDESDNYPVDVRAKSFVGTAEYVSPELLESKYCGKPGDVWAFGCIIYQMIAGKPPFKATNEYLTFQKITKLQFAFSAGFPSIIRDLIKKILVLQPSRRATIPQIQDHFFFESVNFNDFDSIWNISPPEITPYKMTAKSMMKIPDQKAGSAIGVHKTKRNVVKKQQDPNVRSRAPSEDLGKQRNASTTSVNSNGKAVNPAAAAAYALKKEVSQEGEGRRKSSSSGARGANESDYIPGTNILRPVINARHNFSRTSIHKKQESSAPKSKVLEVAPKSSIESAWNAFLVHADERVLKIGPLIVHREATEVLEKKHKGQLHNAPVSLANRVQSANQKHGAPGSSFLSKVINGSTTGLRGSESDLQSVDLKYDEDESKAITEYFEPEEDLTKAPEIKDKVSKRSALLKKFIGTASGNADEPTTLAVRQHPLEKARTCTVLITTHGRVLIFFRNDQEANYKLILEIKLDYPFIELKEIVGASFKFLKTLPSVGAFAVVSKKTSFVFEVEKYEIDHWTECLAKSKLNQHERESEGLNSDAIALDKDVIDKVVVKDSVKPERDEKPLVSEKYISTAEKEVKKPPKLEIVPVRAPRIQPPKPRTPTTPKSSSPISEREREKTSSSERVTSPVEKVTSPSSNERRTNNILFNKTKFKSMRRKPPPTSPTIDMKTGFRSNSTGEAEFLHAAQLAVSQNPTTYNPGGDRRSSFTSASNKGSKKPSSSTGSSEKVSLVTSMNSKLLARSTRTKH